uniref:AIG1-type G domain-containing protein n=1 Tax=Leptobrachium leishanense TaxID=445787 RepID=A0A8C5QPR4_9ANUR
MERRGEDNLQEPYWKTIAGGLVFAKQTIVNKICSIYNLVLTKVVDALFIKMLFGKKNLQKTHKVIMMVGQTGAGKSTLINGMINHILGVEWKDNVRIKLIEEHTSLDQIQTSNVTCYEINHQEGFKIPYSLIILDTPGFGHTGGTEADKHIVKQIRACFTSPAGVQHIDAVCFVIRDTDIRLTDAQKYVFDSVLWIFGKDIEENIIFCVTHCDDPEEPEVINTVVEASVPCRKDEQDRPVYFRFNNSDIPVHSDNKIKGGSSKIGEIHWEESMENMEKFFNFLPNLNTRSLSLTQEVLKERRALQIILEGLIPKMEEQTLKAHELEKLKNTLKEQEADIERNKHFQYEEKETRTRKIKTDETSVNCRECETTCHHPCKVSHSKLAYFCEVFYWNADCRVCGHGQSRHFCERHKWETYVVTVKKTYEELKKKYEEKANAMKSSVQNVCDKLSAEIQTAEREALKLIETAKKCLQRLQEIALKPDPFTITDYISLLINDEASNKKPGYIERIKVLRKLKQQIKEKETRNEK